MKPHYPILDGLRGTAAFSVVVLHLMDACYPLRGTNPLHHGCLAVDFFYLLSGFVIGYAYDSRWESMSTITFIKTRLIRLHPLVIFGVILGAISFWVDPYTANIQHVSLLKLLSAMLVGFTLLPGPNIRGWNETHPLDGPCWSLLQEYIANLLYAFVGRKMNKFILWIVVIISGIALTIVAKKHGDISEGWSYDTFWIAPVRMMFSFFAGLLLFRSGKLIRIPMAYTICSLVLIIIFCLPINKHNGLYEAACIIIAFPIIVSLGAGGQISGRWVIVCKFMGDISYPIYILHYPFIYMYSSWVTVNKPAPMQILLVACGLFLFFILLGYTVLKLYDEPLRARLKKYFLRAKKPSYNKTDAYI